MQKLDALSQPVVDEHERVAVVEVVFDFGQKNLWIFQHSVAAIWTVKFGLVSTSGANKTCIYNSSVNNNNNNRKRVLFWQKLVTNPVGKQLGRVMLNGSFQPPVEQIDGLKARRLRLIAVRLTIEA